MRQKKWMKSYEYLLKFIVPKISNSEELSAYKWISGVEMTDTEDDYEQLHKCKNWWCVELACMLKAFTD